MNTESDIALKRDSIVTIHDQLGAHFSERISSGELTPETQLPSENQLAKDLKISRMTVRRVFETLGYAGLITRRHGKGTYVAPRLSQETGLIGYIGQSLTEGTSSELFSHLSAALERRKSLKWHLLVCSGRSAAGPDRCQKLVGDTPLETMSTEAQTIPTREIPTPNPTASTMAY